MEAMQQKKKTKHNLNRLRNKKSLAIIAGLFKLIDFHSILIINPPM